MSAQATHRNVGITGTVAYHVGFVLLLLFLLRECGSSGDGTTYVGLNVAALGDPENGYGDPQPEISSATSTPIPQEEVQQEDPLETQEESVVTAPKETNKPKKDPVKPVDKPKETPKEEKPKEVSNPLNDALNKLGEKGGSSGTTQPGGNEGSASGVITGKGVLGGGGGSGYEYSFARSMNVKPSLDEKPKDEGTVVVDIWVDKNGNVVKAQANPSHPKTNTSNSDLYKLAEKAAKNAKFGSDPNVTGSQKGTITITFKLV